MQKQYFSLFTLKKDFHKNIKSGMCAKFSKKHMQGNDNTEVYTLNSP